MSVVEAKQKSPRLPNTGKPVSRHGTHASERDRQMADHLLAMVWGRLDQAERLETGADAFSELGRIAALADDVAVLAQSIQLVLRTDQPN